jgi:hypothetical protein
LLLSMLCAHIQAQFTYSTNQGVLTLTGYTGPGGAVSIPASAYGLPVASIGDYAFYYYTSLSSVSIPNSVTNIGNLAFFNCTGLTKVTIPNSVINIGVDAFQECASLTNVIIGYSVVTIGNYAFYDCPNLAGVYFHGNAPSLGVSVFSGDNNATAYYLPEASTWNPQVQTTGARFGVRTNRFGFMIVGASGLAVVVQACTDLTHPNWSPISTNTFSGGSCYFCDPGWMNYPQRFFRLGSLLFGGLPVLLWNPQVLTSDASFGVRTNGFGFTVAGTANIPIAVEACTNLASPTWTVLQTCSVTNGSVYFSDPAWTNYPARFYRISPP